MHIDYNEVDIDRELGSSTYLKGLDVWLEDRVRQVEVGSDGQRVSGIVKGTRRAPYTQSIALSIKGSRLRVTGYCTCPMAFNCKHVAAVLIGTLRSQAASSVSTEPRSAPRPDLASPGKPPEKGPPQVESRTGLSPDIAAWITRLGAATRPKPVQSSRSQGGKQRTVVYLLDPPSPLPSSPNEGKRVVVLRVVTVRERNDGARVDEKPIDMNSALRPREQRPRYLEPADHDLLPDLARLRRASWLGSAWDVEITAGIDSERVIEPLLRTGRLRYRDINGPVLVEGPAMTARTEWRGQADGSQQLQLVRPEADGAPGLPIEIVLPTDPPRYVDTGRGLVGIIDAGLAPALMREVLAAPVIGPGEAAAVKELMRLELGRATSGPTPIGGAGAAPSLVTAEPALLPLPEAPDTVEARSVEPVPCLDLLKIDVPVRSVNLWYRLSDDVLSDGKIGLPIARLSFDYAGTRIELASTRQRLERMEGEKLVIIPRDHKAELKAAESLRALRFRLLARSPFKSGAGHDSDFFLYPEGNPSDDQVINVFDAPERFMAFEKEGLPALRAQGWQVTHADDYPYRLAEGEAAWWADIGESSGIDWLSFELGIDYEGQRINLVPFLVGMLEQLPPDIMELARDPDAVADFVQACAAINVYLKLADGRHLPLPGARVAPALKALLELIGPRGERLSGEAVRVHRAEAALLADAVDITDREIAWAASSARLIELGRNLRRGRSLTAVAPPGSFKAALRPYQSDGLAWIEFLRETGFGGVLADDMGLGKTVQALAFLSREKAEGRLTKPALIVAPTSVLPNWQAEAERFAPDLRVLALRGLDRKGLFAGIREHDLVLTTYPLLARDHDTLLAQEFHIAILDEAQAIKNPKAAVSGIAHRIDARHRLALTGTPLENNLGEVWSLFQYLSPGLLGDETTFRRTFRTPIEKHGDATAQAFLSRRLRPFMLRRTKTEVATELPPKTEIVEHIELEGAQRDLYETVRALMHNKVREEIARKGLAKSHIVFLDALLKLRQICCDPRLLKLPQAKKVKASAKLERLMEMVPEMIAEGRRILLFSQFTSMLALIEEELQRLGIDYVQLTGSTADRAMPVKAFQSGKVPLFLLSLKAGGTGLNLTAADTVIHYDPWWNPAVENQATDRAYRIGQDKPVFVYKLIVEQGIEGAIELLKARKAALADALFAGSAKTPLDLSESDISALFAPLGGGSDLKSGRRKGRDA